MQKICSLLPILLLTSCASTPTYSTGECLDIASERLYKKHPEYKKRNKDHLMTLAVAIACAEADNNIEAALVRIKSIIGE